jgi:hypothetical protein
MKPEEAATILDSIIDNLQKDIAQFTYEIHIGNITGFSASGGQVNVTAYGGGPGSHTTGLHAEARFGDAEARIVKKHVDNGIRAQMQPAIRELEEAVKELRKQQPNKSRLQSILGTIKNTVLAPALTVAITKIVETAIASL